MGNTVQGKNIGGYLKVDDNYFPVFCGKTLRFALSQDMLETTNITSGSSRQFIAGMSAAVMEVTGVTIVDNAESRIAVSYLMQLSVRREVRDWKITITGDSGSTVIYTFQGLIEESSFDKSIPGFSNSYVTVRVSGPVTMDSVAPPPSGDYNYYSDTWATVNGQSYISGNSLGNSNASPTAYTPFSLLSTDIILGVWVEGTEFDQVSGTPAAGSRQYKFSTSPVQIVFPADLIFDGSQRVQIFIKRAV
jgi:predicted secreted protein